MNLITLEFATNLFVQRATNHASKVSAYHAICVLEGLGKISDLNAASEEDDNPLQLERVAFSYNSVKFHMQKVSDIKDLQHKDQEVQIIGKHLEEKLQRVFLKSLLSSDEGNLNKVLRIYSLISEEKKAENCFRQEIVQPFMKDLVTQNNVTKLGLDKVYTRILGFISSSCQEILNMTQRCRRSDIITGFDFLVNAVWPEFIECLGYVSSVHLYSVGDPQLFHQNYSASMKFLDSFETFCGDQNSVRRLRSLASYKEFNSKWNLDVYFQIRFQEIAGEFEKSLLEAFVNLKDENSAYNLNATQSLCLSLDRCWGEGIFLLPLKHHFWRLTLQLLSRYKHWALTTIELGDTDAKQMALLIKDVQILLPHLKILFEASIQPKIRRSEAVDGQVLATFNDTLVKLEEIPKHAGKCIVKLLMEKCTSHLKWISSIPQRFRKTNRELPSKPSPYVSQVLSPLTEFSQDVKSVLSPGWVENCEQEIIDGVMSQCMTQMSDVLTSIKKMEDSLKILKRARDKPSGQSAMGAISDDDKIRRQLAIDVNCFEELIVKSGLQGNKVKSLKELKALVLSAEKAAGVIGNS
ncbi:hypothetical protein JTE90_017650 [Oedothorax gibbosus]|uniref:COG complex component COG2 C-terminal domain-containing protein n=1 Tax=Oedothorax gibbosus TaxID=931172 RepID=A0AAV6U2H7_9ARAC|nr:hypothetical protein JTE90_017650 [Oedothorax gibbosus]